MLLPPIRLRYRLLRRKFQSWFRPALALIMVGTATFGAGAAYWAAEAEEEGILLKQRLIAGRLLEVAAWAQYTHQYATWSALTADAADHKNLGLRLSKTADGIRDADAAEAEALDLQAQEEFARARIYPTFHHFLKSPREKTPIIDSLARDVSIDLARFGFGVDDPTPQTAATPHAEGTNAGHASLAPQLELKFWHVLDQRIEAVHLKVWRYALAVVLFVSALALFTFADLNSRSVHRSLAFTAAGLIVVAGTAAFAAWFDTTFLILVGATCIVGVIIIWVAAARGLLQPDTSEGEPLHAHEVEGKSYWGASLFLRPSHNARSRLAIILIAISVFLSSLVSYHYVSAAMTRDKFSHEALKYQVAFGKSTTTAAGYAIAGALQPTLNLIAKQIHCAAATQMEMFPWPGVEKQVTEFGGIGVELATERVTVRIKSVREDGPAAEAGVHAGDIITHVDGEYMTAMPLNVVVNRLRGRIGTSVVLRLTRKDAPSPIQLTLTRKRIVTTGEVTIAERGEALIRNKKVACEELGTQQSLRGQEELQRAEYDSGRVPGENLYYRTVYSSPSGNPARLYALADGYEELAGFWNRNATVYLASLTLFAIALYLFGQAMGVGNAWQSHTFLSFGTLLVTFSIGWALVAWHRLPEGQRDIPAQCTNGLQASTTSPAERLVEIAAHQYGQGEALYFLADTPAEYGKAATALDCAVAARPHFARAHNLRSSAYQSMDASSRWDTYLPASSWSRLRGVIAARTQTLGAFQRNQVAPPWIAESNAFDELVLALIEGDRTALASSIRVLAARVEAAQQRAKKAATNHDQKDTTPSNSDLYMNYGLALLADNRPKEAEAIYKYAIEELHAPKRARMLVQSLTDLRMLTTNCTNLNAAQTCADLNGSVRKIKESLVAAEWRERPSEERAWLRDVSVQITPHSAGWRAKLDAKTMAEQRQMTVVWYMLDAAADDGRPESIKLWRAVYGLNQTIEIANLKPNADGTIELVVPYLKEQTRCLAEGAYVPEIYIDGALVSSADLPAVPLKRFETYRSRYMNLVMCHPPGWTVKFNVWQFPMRFLDDAEARPSAMLFTFYAPRTPSSEKLKTDYLNTVMLYLLRLMDPSQDVVKAWIGSLYAFQGCNEAAPKGIPHREWVTSEGFVHVALVHLWVPRDDACHILNSLDNYFTPNSLPAKQ